MFRDLDNTVYRPMQDAQICRQFIVKGKHYTAKRGYQFLLTKLQVQPLARLRFTSVFLIRV